jgi:uncharacterized protein (TIGR02597 family)
MSVPLNRPFVYTGRVSSVTGSNVFVQGAPGWTTNQFTYASGTQSNTYFLSVIDTNSPKRGMFYTITANLKARLIVDPAGDDLSTLTAGTQIRITPYWTFGTLFPGGQGVSPSSSQGTHVTEILTSSGTKVGVNLSPDYIYYYYSGSNPGWRRVGGGLNTVRDDDILLPDTFFVYRQKSSAQNVVNCVGAVQIKPFATPIGVLATNTKQDNFVAYPVANSLTLSQMQLFESGSFAGSASQGTHTDELYVFDNTTPGYNKSPIYIYYYYTGAGFGGPGWRRSGGGLSTIRNSDVVFNPGQGFIIRKAASTNITTYLNTFIPPYTP